MTDKLTISTSDASVIEQVSIFNNQGLKLMEYHQLNSGSYIDMNYLSAGLYLIKIVDKNGDKQVIKVSKN